jgi:NADH-quinone oxidoreductase subunit M
MRILGGLCFAAGFASIGLPGFSGFIGEFLSLLGAFIWDRPYAIVATVGVILAAVYALWAFQRAFTGKPSGENVGMKDVSLRELIVVVPLLGLSLFLGLYPKPVLERIQPAVELRVHNLERKSDYREPEPPAIAKEIQQIEREIENGKNTAEEEVKAGNEGTAEGEK